MRRGTLQSYCTFFLVIILISLPFTRPLDVQAQAVSTVYAYVNITPTCALPGQKMTVTIGVNVTGAGGGGGILPVDVSLVIDRTGSMFGQKFADAQAAAEAFVGVLQNTDRVDVISFAETVQIAKDFTFTNTTGKTALDNAIAAIIPPYGYTNLYAALNTSVQQTAAKGRPVGVANKAIILLTDGRPTVGVSTASAFSMLAQNAAADNIKVYTIGLGEAPEPDPVNASLLQAIATAGNGQYFFAPNSAQLKAIYLQLSTIIRGTPATNVRVTEALPTSLITYDNDASPTPNSTTTNTLFWQIPIITAGTSWSTTFTVTAQKHVAVVRTISQTTIVYDMAAELGIQIVPPNGMTVTQIATTSMAASTTMATQGSIVKYNATIANPGLITETFLVGLFANTTMVGQTSVTVANGTSTVVYFSWNTSSTPPGTYTVSITADPGRTIVCNDPSNSTKSLMLTLMPKAVGSILPWLLMILIPLAIIPIVAAALLGRRKGYGARLLPLRARPALVPARPALVPARMICARCGVPLVYYPDVGKWYCGRCGRYF